MLPGVFRYIFVVKPVNQLATSKGNMETTGFRAEKREKRGVDRSVTARSNWGLAFVFNRSVMGGWGLAERRRQRGAEIGKWVIW